MAATLLITMKDDRVHMFPANGCCYYHCVMMRNIQEHCNHEKNIKVNEQIICISRNTVEKLARLQTAFYQSNAILRQSGACILEITNTCQGVDDNEFLP